MSNCGIGKSRQMSVWAVIPLVFTTLVLIPAEEVASQEEVTQGDFVLLRTVDFLTDAVTYDWARVGDPIQRPVPFLLERQDFPGYRSMELSCAEDSLRVVFHFHPPIPASWAPRGQLIEILQILDDPVLPDRQRATVQLRFDTEEALPPSQWDFEEYAAVLPPEMTSTFVENGRRAVRVRARIGPFQAGIFEGGQRDRVEELEFSLIGFARSIELLGCA